MEIKVFATGSKGNCYRVSDGFSTLLIECGIKYADIIRCTEYRISEIKAVLVSHQHKDHSYSAKTFYDMGIDLVMPPQTAFMLCLTGEPNVYTTPDNTPLKIGTFTVIAFPLVHCNTDGTTCENFGYLLYSTATREKLLFATDTAYIPQRFNGINYAMIEVNYCSDMISENAIDEVEKRRLKSHMSLETTEEFFKVNKFPKLKELYAIHTSSARSDKSIIIERLKPFAESVIVP